jgi:hypothetical protein
VYSFLAALAALFLALASCCFPAASILAGGRDEDEAGELEEDGLPPGFSETMS